MVAGVGNESYSWTKDSQVSSVAHPDGTSTTLTRDTAGRATRVVAPWATSTFDYSAMTGQLVSSSRDGQRLDWRYDGMLPVRESSSGLVSGSVSRRYDEDFRVVELAVNDAGVAYAYDDDGLLTAAGPVVMARSATTGQLQTATTGIITTSYTYDVYGAPASIETRVGSTVVFREALTWDDIGRITAKDVVVQGTANRWEYAYDGASRLSQARRDGQTVGVWAYDGNGNRVSADGVAATFDAQDRQLTSGAVTFGYDAFGNRTRRTEGTQVNQYVYDGVGALLSATLPDATRIEYVIDARGRRVGKKRNGNLEKGWFYDGQLRIVAELDGSGAIVSRFIYGSLSHSPDVMLRGGVAYRYVHDVLGNVRLVINVATGQVAQRKDYDSWGVITSDSSPGFQPFGFAGGLYDADTHLTRFGARDYDGLTGRWMSKDPASFGGGDTNLFAYAESNPGLLVDPDGLDPGTPFPLPEEAAKDALAYAQPSSVGYCVEYAGSICQGDRGYSATEPNPGSPNWSTPSPCPKGTKEWGRYHSHGCDSQPGSNGPGPGDVESTRNPKSPNSCIGYPNGSVNWYQNGQLKKVLAPPGTLPTSIQPPGSRPRPPNRPNEKYQTQRPTGL
ncbi:MAG: RHS repeat-associated core domain-containing protein [Myxococcales bacterium]|nr:RHS repeat-associated core domain-containing protein [Myxococcales bacterium]